MKTEAFWEGYRAWSNGEEMRHNPYERGTQEHMDWLDGWIQAGDDVDIDNSLMEGY